MTSAFVNGFTTIAAAASLTLACDDVSSQSPAGGGTEAGRASGGAPNTGGSGARSAGGTPTGGTGGGKFDSGSPTGGSGGDSVDAADAAPNADASDAGTARDAPGVTESGLGCSVPDWTTGGTPNIDDPRWTGAVTQTFMDPLAGGVLEAVSRVVRSGDLLFLQLKTVRDSTPGNAATVGPDTFYRDSIYLAFATNDFSAVSVVRLAIVPTATPPLGAFRWEKSGGTWRAPVGVPAWLTARTAWIDDTSSATPVPWAVDMKIDLAAVPGTKFWYAIAISPNGLATVHEQAWKDRGGFIEPDPPNTGLAASVWGDQFDAIGASSWDDYTLLPDRLSSACGG